jgi:putative ABC transport system ATP-binding protein
MRERTGTVRASERVTVPTIVEARDVRKSFGATGAAPSVEVLHGISVSVEQGEMVSIVGPSGSGKSTLLYCLAGLEGVDGGSVRISGEELTGGSPQGLAAIRQRHMGFVFQSYNLIPSLTALQNVELPARLARRRIASGEAQAALAAVGLAEVARSRPPFLSGGQQQRVAIARALFSRPDVVFADEPTGALDANASSGVLDLLRSVTDSGSAVLMVTHDLEAAARTDRALVIRDGELHSELRRPTAAAVLDALSRTRTL